MAEASKSLNLLETLKEFIEKKNISEIKDALEDMLISRINIAIAGDRNTKKATFINSLRGLSQDDESAARSPSSTAPQELAIFPNPKNPDFCLWDLPSISSDPTFKAEDYIDRFTVARNNAIIITFTERPNANSVAVWREIRSLPKETVYFVLLASAKDNEKKLQKKKAASLEVLKAEGVSLPKVFLVQPSALEKLDFLMFLEVMRGDLPVIRAHALLLAVPAFSSSIVTQKKEGFKALAWAAASLSGGVSAIPVSFVASMVNASVGIRILKKAQISLSLDDESLERLGRQRGLDPARLKALRTCALSVEVSKSEVKRRITEAENDNSTTITRPVKTDMASLAISVSRSFTVMLQALNRAIDDMGADAEKVFTMITGERR